MFRFLTILTACLVAVQSSEVSPKPILDGRIIGGEDVTIENHPYQVSLLSFGNHICGAIILNNNWCLTAAHCVGFTSTAYTIRAGSTFHNTGGHIFNVSEAIQHPNYNPSTIDYDFAVLKISPPIVFDNTMSSIGIPYQSENIPDGTLMNVTGWGVTTPGTGNLATVLQRVRVNKINQDECDKAYGVGTILDSMICAAAPGKDACQGDSGGPLVYNYIVYGVVSWGFGCAQPQFPGVYSRVASASNWIKTNTAE